VPTITLTYSPTRRPDGSNQPVTQEESDSVSRPRLHTYPFGASAPGSSRCCPVPVQSAHSACLISRRCRSVAVGAPVVPTLPCRCARAASLHTALLPQILSVDARVKIGMQDLNTRDPVTRTAPRSQGSCGFAAQARGANGRSSETERCSDHP